MFDNRFVAGFVAGVPISLLCLAYVLLRRDAVVAMFTNGSDALSSEAATVLTFSTAVLIGPTLGLLAAFVYGVLPSRNTYLGIAFVLATLMSLAAVASRTPLTAEKVVLNYSVALALGVLMPRLADEA